LQIVADGFAELQQRFDDGAIAEQQRCTGRYLAG
jgi:hypothetical protein